jgi:hypothetical protein
MRKLPDPDLSLRDSSDFIFDSPLGRKALMAPAPPSLAVFLREIIEAIYKLTTSCHLAEFTDHGLGHLCSLIDRISVWTTPHPSPTPQRVVDQTEFTSTDAAVLLLATLFHDIGMLSQREEDLPIGSRVDSLQSFTDTASWVRTTHIERIDRLLLRLFYQTEFENIMSHPIVQRAVRVARAHGSWPWEWSTIGFMERDSGLAAMLAVADLLDEDSLRCDSFTLLRHRHGTALNCAHWIRHGLTSERVTINRGIVKVVFARPPHTDAQLNPVFAALRNHYRLAMLYVRPLGEVNAGLIRLDFDPPTNIPSLQAIELDGWYDLREFRTQSALTFHLLTSFMAEALLDNRRLSPTVIHQLNAIPLETIDLTDYYRIRGTRVPRTNIEQSFHAILGTH